jgi:hypothetical protein
MEHEEANILCKDLESFFVRETCEAKYFYFKICNIIVVFDKIDLD